MRARNIKPGVFLNEILGQADPILTLLFEGLWCLADREGRLEDRPLRIKAELFPYREMDVNGGLTQLERWGFIQRYEVNGLRLIKVVNFLKHQSPHHTERASKLPDNINGCSITVGSPLTNGGNPPDSLIPDSLIPDSPKASSPSRARGPRKPKKQTSIPEEYLRDLQVICNDWPRRSKKQEGGYQELRIWTDPADLWEAMTKNFPNDDPALMIKCGLVYLDQILPEPSEFDLREPEPPSFCYAMMNFYGPKLAYWKLKKEAARAKMEEQK